MGANPHYFPANDDEFINVAGFDPAVYPSKVSVEEFINKSYDTTTGPGSGDQYDIGYDTGICMLVDELKEAGFASLRRYYTLAERFGMYGVDVVSEEGGDYDGCFNDYQPRTVKLSNGLTLMEVHDQKKDDEFWASEASKGYQEGYDFVFHYKVEAVKEV
jgi:hypothetical protein